LSPFLYSSTDLCYLCLTVSPILVSVFYSNFRFPWFPLSSCMPDKLPMNRETEIKLKWHMYSWYVACWFTSNFYHSSTSQFTSKWSFKEINSTIHVCRVSPHDTDAPASSLNSNLTCVCMRNQQHGNHKLTFYLFMKWHSSAIVNSVW
jgi:hypothetical protein